jgi:2'-5' RNA ligase
MIRLFVALKIPEHIRKEIIRLRNSAYPGYHNLKWEPEDKIHLTLKFIGEIDEKFTGSLINDLDFINKYSRIECSLTRFGFFFRNKEPQILWMGLSVSDAVTEIAGELNARLEKYGVKREKREFKAHLTVMRIKKRVDNSFIKSFENFNIPAVQFIADEIALFRSELSPAGSRYTELKKFNLK